MADDDKKPKTADILAQARKDFTRCDEAASDNRKAYKEDTQFVRAREQWPDDIRKQREADGRPCLTIDKLGPVIRQVVNDARQNKPAIKVHPVDSGADPETAEVINGLIRNIEYTSNADVAYDTAVECAVGGNVGYIRVGLDYAFEDAFEMDIGINRVANPMCVYPDPDSTAADSSDWNVAFVVEKLTKEAFKAAYPKAELTDWTSGDWQDAGAWLDDEGVMVAEYWTREEYEKTIVKASNGRVYDEKQLTEDEDLAAAVATGLITIATDKAGQPLRRVTKCHRVIQRIMSGAEILSERVWPGRYIPIVPVYGDEFWIEGKRYLRSLINGAKDAQRMLNFWRTAGTELVALAPRVPFIGRKGAFDSDMERWNTVNTQSHPFLEYDGPDRPQRQPLDAGVAAGSMQEALNASDDIKAITGIYDASLGARSNETSGRAIMARQREGDVSTFHFIDNMARAIRHVGRIVIDLIPHVYTEARVVRVVGEDKKQQAVQINQQHPKVDPKTGQPMTNDGQPPAPDMSNVIMAMHDLTAGKYDLTVTTGPSFTTQREEAVASMTEMIRAFPAAAPVIGPELAKNFDWPGADKIADRLEALTGQQQSIPPELQQKIEEGQKLIAQQAEEIKALKADQSVEQAKIAKKQQADMAKIAADRETAMAEINSREQIASSEIASKERIATATAAMNARIRASQPQQAAN